ncbi:TPA: fimbrial protein [Escherichia coli]|uniref:fimbrial protein n=1 Tax=Escherichia coli TaxID=562 RepID=UPI0010CB6A93|nr:fimbrial protein [Escherichia coli]MDV5031607.1 fimbrial protein [Escherichia coli]MDV5076680.1 fimbrial protein [Escherichia coli]MDX4965349.1 fimbrial protein [Escherichia coli]GDN89698.1 fimbrial protein [Escherichia coli]HBP9250464.1 fimbrial protein [Escherichia coli]
MKIKVIATLIATVAVGASVSNNFTYASTTSSSLTVNSNLTMGTCTAQIMNNSDKVISEVAFGNVYISELGAKSKVQQFKIRFSNCSGLPQNSAQIVLAPKGISCAGSQASSAVFSNFYTDASAATRTAVEVWTTDTPESNGSTQFHCAQKIPVPVTLPADTTTQPYDYPLSARMTVAEGRLVTDVRPGSFLSPTTFTITYQ